MIKIILFTIFLKILLIHGTIQRMTYELNSKIHSLEASSLIDFVLTQANDNLSTNSLEIETEDWVHQCCIIVKSKGTLKIQLKNGIYPRITAFVGIRQPLVYIERSGVGSITTTNKIYFDRLKLIISDTSHGNIQLEVTKNIDIVLSGSSSLTLSGRVNGTGNIRLNGVTNFDGRKCSMEKIHLTTEGITNTYVVARNQLNIHSSSIGTIYYRGPIGKLHQQGLGQIESMDDWDDRFFTSSSICHHLNYFHLIFIIEIIHLISQRFI